jgi:hypothetical protein
MSNFEQYLHDNGFMPFIELFNRKTKTFYLEPLELNKCNTFSTMVDGRLHNVWVKEDKAIYFGLNEKSKPPTLLSPRPNIEFAIIENNKKQVLENCFWSDDAMNICLKKYSNEQIFQAIYDKNIILKVEKKC